VDQSKPNFWPNAGRVVDDQELFQFFDMLILSGDIYDQSQKLSKIAKKFWAGFVTNFFFFWGGGGHCKNCTQFVTPASRGID